LWRRFTIPPDVGRECRKSSYSYLNFARLETDGPRRRQKPEQEFIERVTGDHHASNTFATLREDIAHYRGSFRRQYFPGEHWRHCSRLAAP